MSPRFSIIPGRFARDARADVAHFRVLNLIGTHTSRNGWCRLKQLAIGEAVGLTRETVCRKIKDLVAWGYVEKRSADATGRAIFYRTLLDAPGAVPPPDEPEAGGDDDADGVCETIDRPVSGGSHVGYNPDDPSVDELHPTCDRSDHTRCDRTRSHQNVSSLTTSEVPPLPPEGGKGFQSSEKLLAQLRRDDRHLDAVEYLIAPVLAKKRWSATDRLGELRLIAAAAHGLPVKHLERAAEIVLADKTATLKPQRLRKAIETVRKAGLMVMISAGTAQWHRWREHFEKTDPLQARAMAKWPRWQVPSEWPPSGGRLAEGVSLAPSQNGDAA